MAAPAIITSVLTGGVNSHQTTSEEANGVYTDFVSEGVVGTVANTSGVAPATGSFAVNASVSPDTNVNISTGVAYVTGTPTSQNSQTFRVKCNTTGTVAISANASGSTKYDWVYIKLDATKLNAPDTAGDDAATVVTSRSSSASADDGSPPTYGYPIAVVTVANGFSTITNGNIRDVRAQVSLNTGTSNANDGWTALGTTTLTTATGYNKGNKEYDLTSSADLTGVLSAGMRMKLTRGLTPPTQSTDLESGSSQYANKTSPSGISFTDDFTCEAWIKLESYTGSLQNIVSRYNGTNGFRFYIDTAGQVGIAIATAGRVVSSFQSVPLGVWVHVAASMDASGAAVLTYINGVSVPNTSTGSATSLTQAGDLAVGAANSTAFFDGKISDVRVWSAVRTATQVKDNMNQQLVGNESNLVSYYKLDGNFNDATSNANNLTAQGSATATNVDNPMNATEYAIVTKVTASTVTVFTGTDYNIPNITLSTPYYSSQKSPFGFPSQRTKWKVSSLLLVVNTQSSAVSGTWYNIGSHQLSVPTGEWVTSYQASPYITALTAGVLYQTLSTANNTESNTEFTTQAYYLGTVTWGVPRYRQRPISVTTQTIHYLNLRHINGTGTVGIQTAESTSGTPPAIVEAECAYI